MAYTARKLVTEAWNLSGIVSRTFQQVDGDKMALGFSLLNDFLKLESIETQNVPYYQPYNFTTVVGQETYFVPYLVDIESMCFYLQNVRIPMQQKSRKEYFWSGRLEGLAVMPFTFRMERILGGANLNLYPLSNMPYNVMAMVKYGLHEVANLDIDFSSVYDRWYLVYMRYALAELMCDHMGVNVPDNISLKLLKLREELSETSPPDMTCYHTSTLNVDDSNLVSAVMGTYIGDGFTP